MDRPVKWSRELHSIRERAAHARTVGGAHLCYCND